VKPLVLLVFSILDKYPNSTLSFFKRHQKRGPF